MILFLRTQAFLVYLISLFKKEKAVSYPQLATYVLTCFSKHGSFKIKCRETNTSV